MKQVRVVSEGAIIEARFYNEEIEKMKKDFLEEKTGCYGGFDIENHSPLELFVRWVDVSVFLVN